MSFQLKLNLCCYSAARSTTNADGDGSSLNFDETECMEVEETPSQEEVPVQNNNITLEKIVEFGTELCEFEKTLIDPEEKFKKIRFVSRLLNSESCFSPERSYDFDKHGELLAHSLGTRRHQITVR